MIEFLLGICRGLSKIMSDLGFRIAQTGYDVKTCTDAQCVVTSKLGAQKIQPSLQGSTTQSIPGTSQVNIQITHNLGYIPAFDAWFEDELGNWKSCFSYYVLDGAGAKIFTTSQGGNHYATSTILNILIENSDSVAHNVTVYYIIFSNPT